MSKLYEKYLRLKTTDKNTLYLFESGTFYYALAEDAELIHKLFGYKILAFGKQTIKSAFPKNSLENRKHFFEINNIKYKIIKNENYNNNVNNVSVLSTEEKILKDIKQLDMNSTSPINAFKKLLEYQNKLKNIS